MLTVVSVTHNGSYTLPQFLDAMVAQDIDEEWKIVVIDNASTDTSAEIIKSYQKSLPLTYLYAPKENEESVYNRARQAIRGDAVVIIGEDMVPGPDYLSRFREVLEKHPEYMVFGSPIQPLWECVPTELHLTVVPQQSIYGLTDSAWSEGQCSRSRISTSSMAVRRNFFYTYFSAKNAYKTGYDNCLYYYTKSPAVSRIIRKETMSEVWVFTEAVGYGRRLFRPQEQVFTFTHVCSYPYYLCHWYFEKYFLFILSLLKLRPFSDAEKWDLYVVRGQLLEARQSFKNKH